MLQIDKDNRRVLESLKLCQSSNPRIPVILLTPFARRIQDYVQVRSVLINSRHKYRRGLGECRSRYELAVQLGYFLMHNVSLCIHTTRKLVVLKA